MSAGAWFMVVFVSFITAAIYCAWEEWRHECRRRLPGYTFDEQIAETGNEAERWLRDGAR